MPTSRATCSRATATSTASPQKPNQAKQAGIDGVPCFILGGVLAVSGAQDPAYLADAMERAVAEVEKRGTAATAAE